MHVYHGFFVFFFFSLCFIKILCTTYLPNMSLEAFDLTQKHTLDLIVGVNCPSCIYCNWWFWKWGDTVDI